MDSFSDERRTARMSHAERLSRLFEIATTLRAAIEPGLDRDAEGRPISAGACLHASVMLAVWISRFGMASARVLGGDGALGQGASTLDGRRLGHYWCEAQFEDGVRYLVDITADQLGFPKIVLGLDDDLRERYIAGRQDLVDEAALELAGDLGCRDMLVDQCRVPSTP